MTDSGSGSGQGWFGQRGTNDLGSKYHGLLFAIRQALAEVRTNHPITIKKVTGGGVAKSATVDVQMLVKQSDGVGNASSHDTIYSRPHGRIQGGLNAIICSPVAGDTHIGHVHDRDASAVESSGKEANPGSFRRHHPSDMATGLTILGKQPNNYVDIDGHIHILSNTDVTITDKAGNTITMNGSGLFVSPGSGLNVYLGGSGTSTSGMSPVVTVAGPSANVFAKHS